MMRRLLIVSAILAAAAMSLPAAAETVQATWKPQTANFIYIGLAHYYSCHSLEDKVRALVDHLGARDVKVKVRPCFDGNAELGSMFKVTVNYSALTEAQPGDSNAVDATWRDVVIRKNKPWPIDDGQCELVERFTRYGLPDMPDYRIVSGHARCSANWGDLVGQLHVKALAPVNTTDTANPAPAPPPESDQQEL